MSLQGKVALVTGASRGIGAAIADTLAAAGAKVIGTATSEGGAAAIGERLAQWGGVGMVLNVGEDGAIDALVDTISKEYGDVAILVNNAGITRDGMFRKMSKADWDAVIDTSITPVQLLAEEKASWQDKLKTTVQKWQQQRLIGALPLTAEQQQLIAKLPDIKVQLLKADTGAKDDKGQKLVSAGLLFLLALGVFSGFGFMFTAITTEKQNRVTEQLLTLLTPQQWMDGKILGISLFCLKSMLMKNYHIRLLPILIR